MTTVLQFSGGKDSLACLYLLKARWDDIIVCWVNTGAAFPETVAFMEEIRTLVPHFHEVRSSQNIERDGYPADIVPVSRSTFGQMLEPSGAQRFQSRYVCCGHALWTPLALAMKELKATTVIRGQKRADRLKAPYESGTVQDNIEYLFPLQEWSDTDVFAYLHERQVVLPRNYAQTKSGLDCWNCTAYLSEETGRLDYLQAFHPEKYGHVRSKLIELQTAVNEVTAPMRSAL